MMGFPICFHKRFTSFEIMTRAILIYDGQRAAQYYSAIYHLVKVLVSDGVRWKHILVHRHYWTPLRIRRKWRPVPRIRTFYKLFRYNTCAFKLRFLITFLRCSSIIEI